MLARLNSNVRVRAVLVLLSVLAIRATVPPFDLWWLAPLAWVPFLIVLLRCSKREAVYWGLSHGVLLQLLSFSWAYSAMVDGAHWSSSYSLLALSSLCVWQGARTAMLCWLVGLTGSSPARRAVTSAVGLALVERFYPMIIPWTLGAMVHAQPLWMQSVAYGGLALLGFLLGSLSSLFAMGVLSSGWARRCYWGACALGWAVLSGLGWIRIAILNETLSSAPELHVGLVQANRSAHDHNGGETIRAYRELSQTLITQSRAIDLLVWPETVVTQAVPVAKLRPFISDVVLKDRHKGRAASPLQTPLILGMVVAHDEDRGGKTETLPPFNSAVLVDHSATQLSRYDKRHLAPVGESLPWPSLIHFERPALFRDKFSIGEEARTILLKGVSLGLSICYEDLLAEQFQESVTLTKPNVLVNLTSDAWFGSSSASALHFALAKFRAVEHERYLVRVTTTGTSGVINPAGSVEVRLPAFKSAAAIASVRALKRTTFYGRWGDWPVVGILAVGSIWLSFGGRRLLHR